MKVVLLPLLLITAVSTGAVDERNFKDSLKKEYEQHVLVPRTPFQEHEQDFDSAGKAVKDPPNNKWEIYGPVLIKKISVESDKLRLEGPRVALEFDKNQLITSIVPLGKSLEFKIRLEHPLNSVSEAEEILNRVFFVDAARSPHPRPEFCHPLKNQAIERVYHVSPAMRKSGEPSVIAPKPIYTPDPDYSDKAREAKYQGIVVLNVVLDKTGSVARIMVLKPVGEGLDEKAVEKLKSWRFQPASLNGEPVAVELHVEVSFQLY